MIHHDPVKFKLNLKDQLEARTLIQSLRDQSQFAIFSHQMICGSLTMKLNNLSELRISSLVIQLIMKKNSKQKVLCEFLAESNSIINQNQKFDFTLENEKQKSSYYGNKMNVQYYIFVKLQRRFKKTITYSEELIILDVSLCEKNFFPSPIKLETQYENSPIILSLYDIVFRLDEHIKGMISFSEMKTKKISEIYLSIINIETIKERKNFQNFTSVICNHQIIEGCPRSNCLVPFNIPLQDLEIWPTSPKINSKYYLELHILFFGEIVLKEKLEISFLFPSKKY